MTVTLKSAVLASWFNKKLSSIPHKNPLTLLLAAPQGVTLSSNVAMVQVEPITFVMKSLSIVHKTNAMFPLIWLLSGSLG